MNMINEKGCIVSIQSCENDYVATIEGKVVKRAGLLLDLLAELRLEGFVQTSLYGHFI